MEVILETDRLLLRKYVEEDAEAFFELNSYPRVLRFVPDAPLLDVEQARQILIDHPIAGSMGLAVGLAFLKAQANVSALRG
jgi:RimJ/RimL family protein N-acetyltransferase